MDRFLVDRVGELERGFVHLPEALREVPRRRLEGAGARVAARLHELLHGRDLRITLA